MSSAPLLGRDLAALYGSGDGRHDNLDLGTHERVRRGERLADLATVQDIDNAVQAVVHGGPDRVDIVLTLSFIAAQLPANLVIPFSFAGAA